MKRRLSRQRMARRRSEWCWKRLVRRWLENKSGVLLFGSHNDGVSRPCLQILSCRTGLLRGARSLRDLYTLFWWDYLPGPPVGRALNFPLCRLETALSGLLFGFHPDLSDCHQDDEHSCAESKDLPDADVLGEDSRQDEAEELRGEDDGHERGAHAPHQLWRRRLLEQRLRRYDDAGNGEADEEVSDK